MLFSTTAAAATEKVDTSALGSLERLMEVVYDPAVLDALNEGAFTVVAFFAVWALGRILGIGGRKARRGSKLPKSVPEVPAEHAASFSGNPTTSTPRLEGGWRTNPREAVRRPSEPARALKKETDALAKAVRLGDSNKLPALIDAAKARLRQSGDAAAIEHLNAQLLLAALRASASRRVFGDGLLAYDHLKGDLTGACATIWSLLFWSAVETSEFDRCEEFLANLRPHHPLSSYDFVNMTRYCVHERRVAKFRELVTEFIEQGCEIDLTTRNRALAACVSGKTLDLAEVLLANTSHIEMDVIAYNTLMKLFATMGRRDRCFEVYTQMRDSGLYPSEMTYGVLIDSLIDSGEMEQVRIVFQDLKASSLPLNVVLYTTYIKGLLKAGCLSEAVHVLEEMSASRCAAPDLVTFATIMKAQAGVGEVMESIRLLEMMIQQGLTPDNVILHTVLTGCSARKMDPGLVIQVLHCLIERGLRPSTTTLSILIKAFAKAEAWSVALDVLEASPREFKLVPEARIYAQLAQSCAHAQCQRDTFNVFVAMVVACSRQGVKIDKAASNRLQCLCASVGEGDRANKVRDAVQKHEGLIDSTALSALLEDVGKLSSADCDVIWRRSAEAVL